MTTSSSLDSRRISQALDPNFVAIRAFQVTKGNKFSAKTALGCILDGEERSASKPCIHAVSRVFSELGREATLTGFESGSSYGFVTDGCDVSTTYTAHYLNH
jgi:hypothetical protein